MQNTTIDRLITRMLTSGDGVSDLLFLTEKPPLVDNHRHLLSTAANAMHRPVSQNV
jgi:predicted amidohydrolase YtcJ